jgi:hypothetical protein
MLTALALIAIAAFMLISMGTLLAMWRAARKQDNEGSSTDVEYRRDG